MNNKETTVTGPAPPTLNYRSIEHRPKAIVAIVALITDLVVSEPTFRCDYEPHFEEFVPRRARFDGADYPHLVAHLRR
jgi:hypothetical protein